VRGSAEQSFDFYDDWEEDENDGLLGWGNDELDRLWAGNNSNYGTVSVAQPGRQRAMNYGNRNRDPRFGTGRRKSAVQPHDGGPDPTIIPSSSYFGFLGRLPFNIGGKGLKYKPSAADLTEHPGQSRRTLEEEQPLIEDSGEDAEQGSENKGHRRQRSHTNMSGHTTDSLSSRGDIFPSEDELDDAVPLDDEFTMALERRTTNQWHDDTSSGKTRASKRPGGSHVSTRTVSSGKRSATEAHSKRSASAAIAEVSTLSDVKIEEERLLQEEEQVRLEEEQEIQRKRQDAQQLALKRGLASEVHLNRRSPSPSNTLQRCSSSPHIPAQMEAVRSSPPPLIRSPTPEPSIDVQPEMENSRMFNVQTAPDSGAFFVDESDYSSMAPTPNRPLSLKDESRVVEEETKFNPAMLPHFGSQPD